MSDLTPSDARLKFDIKDISNGLVTINNLKPKTYVKSPYILTTENDSSLNYIKNNYGYEAGYIAQDIYSIPDLSFCIREVISDLSSNTPLYFVYRHYLLPYHTKAIQELHQLVLTQASTIAALESRISTLENT
jgi:hypothetical protein